HAHRPLRHSLDGQRRTRRRPGRLVGNFISSHTEEQFMTAEAPSAGVSRKGLWTGRTISTVIVLLLTLDSVGKFFKPKPVVDAFAHLGVPIALDFAIGILLLVCTLLYAVPATS